MHRYREMYIVFRMFAVTQRFLETRVHAKGIILNIPRSWIQNL